MCSKDALFAALCGLVLFGCARGPVVTLDASGPPLTVRRPALFPETIEYNERTDTFLVSSFREGAIFEINRSGNASTLVEDPRLCSVLGIAIDHQRGRLWAVNSDVGVSVKLSGPGPKHLAAVGIYELVSGKPLAYVDLAPLAAGPHLLNGIALDSAGNAYVTDSLSPVIYKVDARGSAAVFLRDEQFAGPGINLNGVVVHPDGYLLVVKKSDGSLFRVPLAEPARFSRVAVGERFVGGDGLTLVGKKELVVIANQTPAKASNAAYALASEDGWLSAELRGVRQLGDVYPTTAVLERGTIHVVATRLNDLIQGAVGKEALLRRQATIVPVGRVTR